MHRVWLPIFVLASVFSRWPCLEFTFAEDVGSKHSSGLDEKAAKGALEAAKKALNVLKSSQFTQTDEDRVHLKELGFESADDVANADLGSPLQVYKIVLTSGKGRKGLIDFQRGDDPEQLLIDTPRTVIYPVVVKTKGVRSSLTVSEFDKDKGWHATQRGSPNFIRKLEDYREQKPSVDRIVWIPGLNLIFLGSRTAGQLRLIAVADNPTIKLKAGEERSAHDVFVQLASEARKVLDKGGLR